MNHRPPLLRHALLLAGAALALGSCRSADPALLDASGREVAERPAASFRIGVLPAQLEAQDLRSRSQFRLASTDGAAFSARLVDELRALDAATEVVALPEGAAPGPALAGLDLVFLPAVREVEFAEDSTRPAKAALSTVLWLFTWVGAWFVDDREFRTGLRIENTVLSVDGESLGATLDVTDLESGPVNLTFFDRNEAWSMGFFGSFFLPAWAIGSSFERTSETLTERASTHLAARWKGYLLDELESRQSYRLWGLEIENGASVGRVLDLQLGLTTLDELDAVVVEVNGRELDLPEPRYTKVSGDSPQASTEYRLTLAGLPMAAGENRVRIGLGFRGSVRWRTFRFFGEAR